MRFPNLIILSAFFFFLLGNSFLRAQEVPQITVSPESYAKPVLRVANFHGKLGPEISSLVRRALNLHALLLAIEPKEGMGNRYPILTGMVEKRGGFLVFEGELKDPLTGKSYTLRAEATKEALLAGGIADKILEILTHYQGQSLTKISFVRRTARQDELILTDFLKENVKILRRAELILFPKFSPSGKKLAYLVYEKGKYKLEIYDLERKTINTLEIKGLTSSPVWLPTEDGLILTIEDKEKIGLYHFQLQEKTLSPLLFDPGVIQAGSINRDGTLLAYVSSTGPKPQIYLYHFQSKETKRISFEGKQATSPRFNPKGDKLIYLLGQSQMVIYDLKTKTKKLIQLSFPITDPAFSPSGDYLIFRVKGRKAGIYFIHLDSMVYQPYLLFDNLYYPDWGR